MTLASLRQTVYRKLEKKATSYCRLESDCGEAVKGFLYEQHGDVRAIHTGLDEMNMPDPARRVVAFVRLTAGAIDKCSVGQVLAIGIGHCPLDTRQVLPRHLVNKQGKGSQDALLGKVAMAVSQARDDDM
jgi:hypothetical protein